MRFLVDAQLPRRIAHLLREQGHQVIHTLELPKGNRTPDSELLDLARLDNLILVSKDTDFLNSQILYGEPKKLLLVTTGNIDNGSLLNILRINLTRLESAFGSS